MSNCFRKVSHISIKYNFCIIRNKLKIRKETLYHEKDEFKEKCKKEIINYEREKEIWKENTSNNIILSL